MLNQHWLLLHSNERWLNIVLWSIYHSGAVCLVPFLPPWTRGGLDRDLARGRCEVDLRFFHFSGKIKDLCVVFFFLFHPPVYSGFNRSPPPEPDVSHSVNKCERLEIVPRVPGWRKWTRVTRGGCGFENVCLTHSVKDFQRGVGEHKELLYQSGCVDAQSQLRVWTFFNTGKHS